MTSLPDSSLAARLNAALPQTQCTRCGFPDCASYAQAVAAGDAAINQCPPGGVEGIARLAAITGLPAAVVAQRAGVRPAVRDRKPLLGPHPALPMLSFCGGYGSKGVMLAPRLAELLAEHLLHDMPLWPEADLARCVEKFYVR